MTSADYNYVMGLLTNDDLYDFATRLCERYHIDPVKTYRQRAESEVMKGAAKRILYVSKAANLMRRGIFLGATVPEMLQMAQNLIVMVKAIDDKLDFRTCQSECDISNLEKKYSGNEFLSLNVELSEFKRVIERDNDFYGGVKIK